MGRPATATVRAAGWRVLLAAWGLIGTSCGGYTSFCEEMMACLGGNQSDVDACVVEFDAGDDLADAEGCTEEWDELATCEEEEARCEDDVFSSGDACDRERTRWQDCMGDVRL